MISEKVVVVGAGGLGREIIEIFKAQNDVFPNAWDILGFLDDDDDKKCRNINGFYVLGGLEWLEDNYGISCVVAVGDSRARKKIVEKLKGYGVNFVNAIHPSVVMSDSVTLGEDVIICAGCVLTTNIVIGDHVILNMNCTVGHDAVIKDFVSAMPSVNINGFNNIGMGVYIGCGVNFIHEVSVGDNSVIGAGAVVVRDIPSGVTAVGVPCRPVNGVD